MKQQDIGTIGYFGIPLFFVYQNFEPKLKYLLCTVVLSFFW
jgi:hypothetical protein